MGRIPPIGKPPGSSGLSGDKPPLPRRVGQEVGGPRFEIRHCEIGVIQGPYFVLIDSKGKVVHESNVFLGGEEEEHEKFCEDGAVRELNQWKARGKIS